MPQLRFAIYFALSIAALTAYADTELFNKAGWVVDGADDAGPNPRNIRVTVNRIPQGEFSELKIFHEFRQDLPQVLSAKGVGAIRVALPNGEFGGTFYATGYWDCVEGFIQNLFITRLDIRLLSPWPDILVLTGTATNESSLESDDFTLYVLPPSANSARARAVHPNGHAGLLRRCDAPEPARRFSRCADRGDRQAAQASRVSEPGAGMTGAGRRACGSPPSRAATPHW